MLRNNKLNLVISILAAIVIWAYVSAVVNPIAPKTIQEIPVKLTNTEILAERGYIVTPGQAFFISVDVKGSRSEVEKLTADDFEATADLTGFSKGTNTVRVNVTLPEQMELVEQRPKNIEVQIEDLITVTKPVRLVFDGDFPAGTEPGFMTIAPDEMEVSGTQNQINSIAYIRAQVSSDELDIEPKTLNAAVVAVNKIGEPVYDMTLSQDTVEINAMLCNIKEVPLLIETFGEIPGGGAVTAMEIPETISIRGSYDALRNITSISAPNIDLGELTETIEIPIIPNLPNGVELAEKSWNIAAVIEIEGIAKNDIFYTADEIEIVGLPEGYTAVVNTPETKVTIYGYRNIINQVVKGDIRPFIDLGELEIKIEAGQMNVELKFEFEKDIQRIAADPTEVVLIIAGASKPGSGSSSGTHTSNGASG